MNKILWIDTETTGLSSWKNGIIQLSGFIEIDGVVVAEFDFNVKPFPKDEIDNKALEVNKVTRQDLECFQSPQEVYNEFVNMLNNYVNRFDKEDKFILAGYNINFDKEFLKAWFKKCGDNYFHSYVDYHVLDVMSAAMIYVMAKRKKLANLKLATICGHFGIEANFHNSMDDIRATKEVYHRIMYHLQEGEEG